MIHVNARFPNTSGGRFERDDEPPTCEPRGGAVRVLAVLWDEEGDLSSSLQSRLDALR
jgi:hypothetical protein